jgi:hypothetical protein
VFATTTVGNVVTLERTTAIAVTALGVTATGALIARGTLEGADRGVACETGPAMGARARCSAGGLRGWDGIVAGLTTPAATGVGGGASERDISAAATPTTPTLAIAVPRSCNSLRTVTRLMA